MTTSENTLKTLSSRRELLFLYDIRMGNPNGDPDENRPRVLPDGTHYITDVRLKRFVRDYLKQQGCDILVDTIQEGATNLTGRVADYLKKHELAQATGVELVKILLESFVDARLFGSSFAFKEGKSEAKDGETAQEPSNDEEEPSETEEQPKAKSSKKKSANSAGWKPEPKPKTLTGPVQFNHGEVLHKAQEIDIHGTSVFASDTGKTQGTFTTYYGLRYALIGFNGIANEHNAKISQMTDEDYQALLQALWNGVRSAGNTRTKVGQVPRLLLSIEYEPGSEFQYGCLLDYVKLLSSQGKEEMAWSSPEDYLVDLSLLVKRLDEVHSKIQTVRYQVSPDIRWQSAFPPSESHSISWQELDLENLKPRSE